MFISTSRRGYIGTEQYASGRYVVFFSDAGMREIYAYCRKRPVALRQCGHWMMGSVTIDGVRVALSGEAGSDGLPCDIDKLPQSARRRLVRVPDELAEQYRKSDGHNSIGKAGAALRGWAQKQFA